MNRSNSTYLGGFNTLKAVFLGGDPRAEVAYQFARPVKEP